MMKNRSQVKMYKKMYVEIADHHGKEAMRYGIRTPFGKERVLLLRAQL